MKVLKNLKFNVSGFRYFCIIFIFHLVLYTFLCIGEPAFAEEKVYRYRLINVDLLGAVFGIVRVEYQQNMDEKNAWALRGIYWHSTTESWKWDGYGGGLSLRRYITHKSPEGGWVGGGIDFLVINARFMGKEDGGNFLFPHAEIGYTFSLSPTPLQVGDRGSVWFITPSVSLGNYIGNIEISNSNIPISGAGIRLSVLLSYLF
ncbi:MAG: hypothetical protein HY578_00965 [Nitrospinae bacterium]|nr:hypothetical protein [Nitrospinota bacterium]